MEKISYANLASNPKVFEALALHPEQYDRADRLMANCEGDFSKAQKLLTQTLSEELDEHYKTAPDLERVVLSRIDVEDLAYLILDEVVQRSQDRAWAIANGHA